MKTHQPETSERRPWITPSGTLLILGVLVLGIYLASKTGNVIDERRWGNDRAAIGALKTIAGAQGRFREEDTEGDGLLDYGTLAELSVAGGLVDPVLGSGAKQGYLFEACYSSTTSEFLWMATARPVRPGTTGKRYFATNHQGVVFYTTSGPFELNTTDCTIPPGAKPTGR